VTCPWHDSVFELCDGQVIHGPATNPLPRYEVRINQGQIEIRAAGDN
jgi:nitrite reductase/ring-hydroxylating ferredoxin subunit